ncbi:hypothetical protein GCM10009817_20800 [Terrabacter lapilli]|uniref:Uncharacterized protein n=1 Tax=Terrabacter lapilli TaxID=436231 RepID=A0ABN2S470_9MICO
MTKARVFPHRRLAEESLSWGNWLVSRHGGAPERVEDRVDSWDYATPISFGLTVDVVDCDALEASAGCPATDLDVVVLVDCPSSGARYHKSASLQDLDGSPPLMVDVPVGVLASQVRLSAHVVLRRPLEPDGLRAARPSSRLAESPTKGVVLEGDGHRFPTEAVSFKDLRLEPAAWTLRVEYASLDDSFVGSVRLLVNTDHPAAAALLDVGESGSKPLHSFLRLDVVRQLVMTVALDHGVDLRERAPDEEGDGSLRAGLEALCATFLSMDLASAVQLARDDPGRFERRAQAGVEFLEDVS